VIRSVVPEYMGSASDVYNFCKCDRKRNRGFLWTCIYLKSAVKTEFYFIKKKLLFEKLQGKVEIGLYHFCGF